MVKKLIILSITIILVGCVHSQNPYYYHEITYDTFPQSAILVCDGIQKGNTPKKLTYTVHRNATQLNTKPCKAVWTSGEEAEYPTQIDITNVYKNHISVTHANKNNLPSDIMYDQDRKFEQQQLNEEKQQRLQNQKLQQQQAVVAQQNQLAMQKMSHINSICSQLSGTSVNGADTNEFIGYITQKSHKDSIFNPRNRYKKTSVWSYGKYGNRYTEYSALSKKAKSPPRIYRHGQFVGYLTVNPNIQPGIDPNFLKESCNY